MYKMLKSVAGLMLAVIVLAACAAPATPPAAPAGSTDAPAADQSEVPAEAPAEAGAVQIPEPRDGAYNVAFVYVGPIGDGGWTYAHNEGRLYVEETLGDAVHTAYLESVPEGADAERVIRGLARAGFDAIFTTSFGFMDPTETVAEEFPDVNFVHVSGYKSNGANFGNLFGAMENMKYLAGMIAGARAMADENYRIGYIAPFPIEEVIRHINATAMGMRATCPDCIMDIRWIFTWFDPNLERESAESLIQAGAGIVITGADTTGPIQVAGEMGVYGIGYDSRNACDVDPDACLTTPYWEWGPRYVDIINAMMDGSFAGTNDYFDVDSGALGLLGFMEGQEPAAGVPEDVIDDVRELLAQMEQGEFTRFDLFTGPIRDNKGEIVVPEGVSLTQSDLEGISGAVAEQTGRESCTICMKWLVEGVNPDADLP